MQPLRVAHLGPSALPVLHQYGGAIERRMLELAKAQAVSGNSVRIYSADPQGGVAVLEGVEIRNIVCKWPGRLRPIEFLTKALRDLRRNQVDILHFHSIPEGAAFAQTIPGLKVLSYDYFLFKKGKRTPLYWFYRNALQKFDRLLPVSDYCLTGSKAYWELRDAQLRTLYNGVNVAQFRPDDEAGRRMRTSLGLGADPVILYVGRICRQKGTDLLLDAYLQVKQQSPSTKLVIAGPTGRFGRHKADDLTKRISQVGGIYIGTVSELDLPVVYSLCNVFVMPTREHEMFGMAALEAQACGKPVICSKHGGLTEVITDGSGVFFSVGDSKALADKLTNLLLDQKLQRQMSLAARENALRFAWTRIAEQLALIYSDN